MRPLLARSCPRALGGAGLVEHLAAEFGDLVRADHQRLRMGLRHRLGLGDGQPQGARRGCLIGQRRFIDARRGLGEFLQ